MAVSTSNSVGTSLAAPCSTHLLSARTAVRGQHHPLLQRQRLLP